MLVNISGAENAIVPLIFRKNALNFKKKKNHKIYNKTKQKNDKILDKIFEKTCISPHFHVIS